MLVRRPLSAEIDQHGVRHRPSDHVPPTRTLTLVSICGRWLPVLCRPALFIVRPGQRLGRRRRSSIRQLLRHGAILVDEDRSVVIWATFVGPDDSELLQGATIAIVGEVPIDMPWHAVPAYPTVNESGSGCWRPTGRLTLWGTPRSKPKRPDGATRNNTRIHRNHSHGLNENHSGHRQPLRCPSVRGRLPDRSRRRRGDSRAPAPRIGQSLPQGRQESHTR